jgi:hypothetical protein
MSKYKYKLVEQEEGGDENGLKSLKTKSELFLTGEEGTTADDLIKIINDPKNLEGVYTIESGGLKELKLKAFGDRPNIRATLKINTEIYKNNGKSFYTEIETVTGEKFDKKGAVIKKDTAGNTIFIFPQKNAYNEKLVEKYFNLSSEDKKSKKSNLRPTKIDNITLKFPASDEKDLKKILKKSGLPSGKYSIKIEKDIEENKNTLKKLVKEEILKFYKK